ncbi:MAG: hypothetical protein GWN37_10635, partial [Gammaproteobacteria bacterium]|nr:hypothetical protein [Gammaproteobacteria bacterium]
MALTVTMLGIFVGAWIASRVRVRFETWLLLVPLVIGAIYSLYLPILRLEQRFAPWDSGSEALLLVHKLLFGCAFALGPMILFGALLPALMRTEKEVAGESGYLLFVSSMANAAGYLAYVVIGHPALETGALLATLAGLALLASLIAGGLRRQPREALAGVAGAALVLVMFFQWEDRDFYLAQWVDVLREDDRVTVFKSGPESATLVADNDDAWVTYNGHPSIEVQDENVVNLAETISGVIPALGAPRLERALVLGFGTGITSGATARLFDRTDVV